MNAPQWLSGLVAHAYTHAPAVRAILDSAGIEPIDVRSLDDLERVPITRKDALIDLQQLSPPFGGFLSVPQAQLARVFLSPGPLFDPQGLEPDYWRFAQALRAAGFQRGEVVLNASSYHLTPMGIMLDDGARALGCVVIPAGVGNTELQLTAARELGATGYCGTPSFLNVLLDKGDDLLLRHAFVAGEMLPQSLRDRIQARGVSVFQGYGTADLGLLAFECAAQDGMHVADGAVVEIVDPTTSRRLEAGLLGEVVATVNSRTYPLLRFGTGDLSVLDESACSCGSAAPRLMGIRGRVGDAVKVRGMFVHPRQLDDVLGRFPEVVRYQAVVDRVDERDTLRLRLEASGSPEGLVDQLRDVLHVRPDVELVPAGSIAEDAKRLLDRRAWGNLS
jgi:phenylacetate-CoA ligase